MQTGAWRRASGWTGDVDGKGDWMGGGGLSECWSLSKSYMHEPAVCVRGRKQIRPRRNESKDREKQRGLRLLSCRSCFLMVSE